jgi:diguanylate cyclase (GGDEF)-like protein
MTIDMQTAQEKLLQSIIKITSQCDQDSLEFNLVSALAELMPIRHASLYRCINEDIDYLIEETICLDFQKNNLFELKQFRQREIRIIETTEKLLQCIQTKKSYWSDHGTWFLAPIMRGNTVAGVILLESDQKLSGYHSLFNDVIRIYENYLFVLIEGELDTLTGLRNRRTFDKQLGKLLKTNDIAGHKKIKSNSDDERRQLIQESANWLVSIDIDHFKRINDNFGHLYGDEVLLLLSQLMKKIFRDTDLLFRFGGEEFVIILTSTTEKNAFLALERFRKMIADYNFPQIKQVTLSIGYAQINSDDFPVTILDKADKALYFAKQHGRNLVCCYENLISQGKLQDIITHETELF